MGIRSPLQPVCSIALGTQDVTPLDMASAYATIAAHGVHHAPTPVSEVTGPDGNVVARFGQGDGTRVLSRNDDATLTWAMQGVVQHGTGVAAAMSGRPVAGKTGTAQNYTNAWFCGFVPQLATCVWMGFPQGNVPMENMFGLSGVVGGSIPAAIWHDFITVATRGMPVKGFPTPDLSVYRITSPSQPPPVAGPSPTAVAGQPSATGGRSGTVPGNGNAFGVGNGNGNANGNGPGG
jgi:penicillin-binding protein 1A